MKGISLSVLRMVSDSDYEDIKKLLSQLYDGMSVWPTGGQIEEAARVHQIIVARTTTNVIVGMATLVTFRRFALMTAHAEDVVVRKDHRRYGIGKMLMKELEHRAKELDAKALDLETDPERKAAQGLYDSLGYKRRPKIVFRKVL